MIFRRVFLVLMIAAWFGGIGYGAWEMTHYATRQSIVREPPKMWPDECDLRRDPRRSTLLVFMHPHCACSRATMNELDRLLMRHRDQVTVYAVFMRPEGFSADWHRTDLWDRASGMPGVQAVVDHRGIYQRLFRTSVSGEVTLYGQENQLQFHGGITLGRGHEGDNAGSIALSDLLACGCSSHQTAAVYGCSLSNVDAGPEPTQ